MDIDFQNFDLYRAFRVATKLQHYPMPLYDYTLYRGFSSEYAETFLKPALKSEKLDRSLENLFMGKLENPVLSPSGVEISMMSAAETFHSIKKESDSKNNNDGESAGNHDQGHNDSDNDTPKNSIGHANSADGVDDVEIHQNLCSPASSQCCCATSPAEPTSLDSTHASPATTIRPPNTQFGTHFPPVIRQDMLMSDEFWQSVFATEEQCWEGYPYFLPTNLSFCPHPQCQDTQHDFWVYDDDEDVEDYEDYEDGDYGDYDDYDDYDEYDSYGHNQNSLHASTVSILSPDAAEDMIFSEPISPAHSGNSSSGENHVPYGRGSDDVSRFKSRLLPRRRVPCLMFNPTAAKSLHYEFGPDRLERWKAILHRPEDLISIIHDLDPEPNPLLSWKAKQTSGKFCRPSKKRSRR